MLNRFFRDKVKKEESSGLAYRKNVFHVFFALTIVILTFSFGYYFGAHQQSDVGSVDSLVNKTANMPDAVDFSPFWRAWNILEEKYVPAVDTDNSTGTDEQFKSNQNGNVSTQEKVWGAIQGLARSLNDSYTIFLPPQDSKTFEEDISGNFEGVGMEIGMRDGILTVVAPLKGSPAQQAGLQSQDRIIEIDGESTQSMSVDEAVQIIRGERGTEVVFTIIREENETPLSISVIRDNIQIPTIDTEYRNDGIFVIKLYNFSERSPLYFRQAIIEFARSGSNKLILDLRQNPGGFLSAAVDMTGYFLPEGSVVVREDFGNKQSDHVYRSPGYNLDTSDLSMVVLVDRGSASASEIMAGALSEHGIATLVGSQTFGKGSVQELVTLTDNPKTSLKVTVARWLTPNGVSISKGGLTPEIKVEMTAEQFRAGEDPQMDAAVNLLLDN